MTRLKTFVATSVALLLMAAPATGQTAAGDVECDVFVNGDSLAGVGAAVSAARAGATVCLGATTGYAGGQATAAGVSTMDEGSVQLRESGLYGDLVDDLTARIGPVAMRIPYFAAVSGADMIGADPAMIRGILDQWLSSAGVRVYPYLRATDVIQDGRTVSGVVGNDGIRYQAAQTIDASEVQELYPMVEGLEFVGGDGSCAQNVTWTVSLNWYPEGVPELLRVHANPTNQLTRVYGAEQVNQWLEEFRAVLGNGADAGGFDGSWDGLSQRRLSFDGPGGHVYYRAVPDHRAGIRDYPGAPEVTQTTLNWVNDSEMSVQALYDPALRQQEFSRAMAKTLLLLSFIRHELGITNWGISNHLGYENVPREFNNPYVSDRLEPYFPPIPYVREGLRLGLTQEILTGNHLADSLRGTDIWGEQSVMTGAYYTDTHECGVDGAMASDSGLYGVPHGIFIPKSFDGFLAGMARGAGVDRAAASSLRMQPTELLGGQVVGTLAALAVAQGTPASEVTAATLRSALVNAGVRVGVNP